LKRSTKIAFLLAILAAAWWGYWAGWTIFYGNDWINRCADESHRDYIVDAGARRKACE